MTYSQYAPVSRTALKTAANKSLKTLLCIGTSAVLLMGVSAPAVQAQLSEPTLAITGTPLPERLRSKIYTQPTRQRAIEPADIGTVKFNPVDTLVSRKLKDFQNNLSRLQGDVGALSTEFVALQDINDRASRIYFSNVATINNQLQSGTTPGNPRLVEHLREAESNIALLGGNVSNLNTLAVKTGNVSSEANFLLEEARAAYSISGAVEEDHINLAKMEDSIDGSIILIERMLNDINDDIARTSAYLNSERNNLRTLALAVTNGELYGPSLVSHPFNAQPFNPTQASFQAGSAPAGITPAVLSSPRPLAKIRFDRANVDFEQPVFVAVSQALERYPGATIEVVGVTPARGNAAQVAIETTRSRRNAEKVLRTLSQMGVALNRINVSTNQSTSAQSNEVHLFVR